MTTVDRPTPRRVTALGAYRPPPAGAPLVAEWWRVDHPDLDGVTTFWRDRACAEEHADRCLIRFGRRPFVVAAETLP